MPNRFEKKSPIRSVKLNTNQKETQVACWKKPNIANQRDLSDVVSQGSATDSVKRRASRKISNAYGYSDEALENARKSVDRLMGRETGKFGHK